MLVELHRELQWEKAEPLFIRIIAVSMQPNQQTKVPVEVLMQAAASVSLTSAYC